MVILRFMHTSHPSGIARRPVAAFLGLFCAAMGLFAIAMTVSEYNGDRRARSTWVTTRCLIQEATIRTQFCSALATANRRPDHSVRLSNRWSLFLIG